MSRPDSILKRGFHRLLYKTRATLNQKTRSIGKDDCIGLLIASQSNAVLFAIIPHHHPS
jgi:hypothetical protein